MNASTLQFELDLRPRPLCSSALELRQAVRRFLEEELKSRSFEPTVDAWLRGFDRGFSRTLAERGWVGMTIPTHYGGHGRSQVERFVVIEELLAAGAPVAAHWIADRQAANSILSFGSEPIKRRVLPRIARGDCVVAIGYSEPDVGSDLASVRTRAERTREGWRLTGTKIWTSHAHHADLLVVLCRTSPRTEDRHAGLSVMVVELPHPKVKARPVLLMTGEHHFNEVVLEGVDVPEEMVLGQVGEGWKVVTSDLALERSGPERFLSTYPVLVEMLRRAAETGDRCAGRAVASLAAQLYALRAMSLAVAQSLDAGDSPIIAAAVVKDIGTRFEQEIAETARHIFACEPSLDASDPLQRHLAVALMHSPAYTVRGGTNEILRGIVAKGLGLR
ncbi:acyl-CoA dehydrogenase family protein [Rhodoligotrophos defluvii]|uniref:acyl-CoA dehydrogenase family protein n=1 Tax=Rhodoligotrophos defluvii TaxID=2561934 RepID=UPI0010CA0052|nr:acyl-CoA dehydrogenase family protein [Rhodoligotrophos defluvii]